MRKGRVDDLSASVPDYYLNLISGFGKARVLDSKTNTLNRGNGFYMAIEMQITMKNSYDEMGKYLIFQSKGKILTILIHNMQIIFNNKNNDYNKKNFSGHLEHGSHFMRDAHWQSSVHRERQE